MKTLTLWLTRVGMLLPALAILALLRGPGASSGDDWRTDLVAAMQEAKAAGKDVLVEFTVRGGDSRAEGTPALDRAVYDKPEFLGGVGRRFVPVRLTVNTDAADGADGGVVAMAERLTVGRVPSLVLMDAEGRPYGAVESEDASVDAQLALVAAAAEHRPKRDAAFARAAACTGRERAAHLDEALRHVGRFVMAAYESSAREIVHLDPDNASKLNEKYAAPLAEKQIDWAVQTVVYPLIDRADFAGALTAIDKIIADENPPAAHRQTLVGFKGQILFSMGRGDEAKRVLHEALALAPQGASAAQIRTAIERMGE